MYWKFIVICIFKDFGEVGNIVKIARSTIKKQKFDPIIGKIVHWGGGAQWGLFERFVPNGGPRSFSNFEILTMQCYKEHSRSGKNYFFSSKKCLLHGKKFEFLENFFSINFQFL
jgi:YHS domain-containing protein